MTSGKHNIFLIGPMGSGKTAVGRALARLLERPFYDSDHEIELRTGADIPLIFEREGEAGFRRREREMIAELTQLQGVVLATGGGAILAEENRRHLSERGWVVYLETSVAQQVERAGRTSHRPLLHGTDPRVRLDELMRIREPLYQATADLTVSTNRRRVAGVAERIVEAWRGTLAPHADTDRTSG
ncbi:MAG: shikimate kinase AroK [Steroidobacteraceae bacterium]